VSIMNALFVILEGAIFSLRPSLESLSKVEARRTLAVPTNRK
jgi:hypothetical protein